MVQHLEEWAGQVDRAGLEAGPTSEWLIANLIELGWRPSVWKLARLRRHIRHAG